MSTQSFLALGLALFIFSKPCQAQDAQDASIKQVILAETDSYFKKDSAAWAATWLPEASASASFASAYGYSQTTGWDSLLARQSRFFRRNPTPDSIQMSTDSFTIRKDGKLAVVDYKQTVKDLKAQPPFDEFISLERRVLVKKNGKWKIAQESTTNLNGYVDPTGELTLNAAGYAFLSSGNTDKAIQVLELNTKFFPESYNVFDSLGEAYAKAGKKELAISNYEKSLQLNPKNDNGKKALEDLRK